MNHDPRPTATEHPLVTQVVVRDGRVSLPGTLAFPERGTQRALGVVLFAHGSGSGRRSPRNRFVAAELRRAGLATLLFDLLTEAESDDRARVFDIPLLTRRLLAAVHWTSEEPATIGLPVGLFGASTGAAAALDAAVVAPKVGAVVSRGGRPDLAGEALAHVVSPTLLIVGGDDSEVLELNRAALRELRCTKELAVVPGATHLFEEPGALEQVARFAARWFVQHLQEGARP